MGLEILVPIAVAAAGAGSAAYFNKKATDANLRSVLETNETNVALNRETREWNEKMQDKQNEYNSPLQQRLRAEIAGLNPLFMTDSPGLQPAAVSSNSPVVSAPYQQPTDSPLSVISSLFQSASSAMLAKAQTDNINQNTQLQNAQTDITRTDALFRKAYNQGVIDLQSCSLRNMTADTEVKKEQLPVLRSQAKEIDANCSNIYQNIEQSKAYTALLGTQNEGQKVINDQMILDYIFSVDTFETRKQQLIENLHCTEAQAVNFLSQAALAHSEQQIADVTNTFLHDTLIVREGTEAQNYRAARNKADLIHWDAANSKYIFDFNNEHGETNLTYQRIGMVTGAISDVTGSVGSFLQKRKNPSSYGEGSMQYGTKNNNSSYSVSSNYYDSYKSYHSKK